MRTLKKVLALTVVLATVFSLTAFAAFTDADQINESCQDDINLMNALNVMVGDAEGTFRPNGTISRAEAAKMVYVVRNGGVDDKASGWTGMSVFTDVPAGAWYEGYVNYCASLGIIAGVGGNRFNPDGAVTGVELAKMMLVVADYKPDVEGYTGANWSLNVIDDAQQANMFDGYALAFSSAAPRQWAAKLFSNAILKTRTAVYFGGERINDVANLGSSQTVGTKYFNLRMVKGYLIGTENVKEAAGGASANASTQKSTIALTEDMGSATTDLKAGQAFSFIYNAPVELLQQEVYVVVDTLHEKVYNVYPTEKSVVYDVNFADVTFKFDLDTDGKTAKNTELGIAFEGYSNTTYKVVDKGTALPITFYMNDKLDTAVTKTPVQIQTLVNSKDNFAMRMVDRDGDGMIDVAFVTESDYAVVTSYNAARNVFTAGSHRTNGNAEKFAEYNFVDSVNVGDIVKITADDTGKNLAYNVERLSAAVSGQITKTSKDGDTFTISGTEYALGANQATTTPDFKDNLKLGNEVDLYTDGKYVVYAALTGKSLITELSSNLAYLIDADSVDGTDKWGAADNQNQVNKVQVLLADNTTKVYTYLADASVDAATQLTFDSIKSAKDTVYEYVLSGETIVFKKKIELPSGAKEEPNANAKPTLDATKKTFDGKLMDDDTWFFVKSLNAKSQPVYAVMKASEFTKDVTSQAKKQIIYQPVNGMNTVMMGVLDVDGILKNEVEDYAFTTTDWYNTVVDEKAVKVVDVINSKGEAVTLTLASTDGVAAYKVYNVSTASGKSTLSKTDFVLAALTGANDKDVLQFDGSKTMSVAKDAKIWYLDCDPATGKIVKVDGDGYPLAEQLEDKSYNKNALYRKNDKDEVTDLYIEVDGDAFGKIDEPAAVEITSVTLTMDALTYKATLPIAAADKDAGFTVKSTAWADESGNALNAAPADTTTEYAATIVLTAKDKAKAPFSKDIAAKDVTIEGYTVVSAEAKESVKDAGYDTLTIKTEAKAAAKATVGVDSDKNKLAVTLALPTDAQSNAEDKVVSLTKDGISVATKWTDSTSNEITGSNKLTGVCTVEITISLANTNYVWPEALTAENGKNVATFVNTSGITNVDGTVTVALTDGKIVITAKTGNLA